MSRPSRTLFVLALCCVLISGIPPTATATAATAPTGPHLVELYPNTSIPNDVGEYVTLSFPEPTALTGWTLTDGETTTRLGDETVVGRVAFSRDPSVAREKVDDPVLELRDHFVLAQAGETVQLRYEGHVVDETAYERAPRAQRWLRTDDGWEWRPRGATAFEARDLPADGALAFVLSDSPGVPLETLRGADERILLASYTFSSEPTAEELRTAAARGVEVRVLVDGTPVGGQTVAEAAALDSLVNAGVPVRVFDGPVVRYRFHHPKYAVVDDRVIVLTENWKPSGTGGRASRGWGIVIESAPVADALAAVFVADAGWEDTVDWQRYRENRRFVADDPATGSYPEQFDPAFVEVSSVRIAVAPDNAEAEILALLEGAEESIRIEQVTIDSDHAFLRAAIEAAERGVHVRILLDDSWYVERENRALVERLERLAEDETLPLEARLVDSSGEFEKIHAKGVVVDDRRTLVGSINWNENSVRNNREVAVVVESEATAAFYAAVFDADWRGGRPSVPVGVGLAVAGAAGGAVLLGRRLVEFEAEN
ncbi:phospholipase D-like domain-containing protein [Halalkalicoccus salilacus]|uniref:phospholipase D-like domain-containing protein n=1 Tax=Halalkalicoccus salilacus TaxID=3117459 RepID=UPI00300E87F6